MKIDKLRFNKLYKSYESKGTPVQESMTAKKYKKRIAGKTLSQFDEEYWEYLLELLNTADQYEQQEKNEIVDSIAEYYTLKTGYSLPITMINCLADFILDDILASKDVMKATNSEYPIHSFRQTDRRKRWQVSSETTTLDYFSATSDDLLTHKRKTTEKRI